MKKIVALFARTTKRKAVAGESQEKGPARPEKLGFRTTTNLRAGAVSSMLGSIPPSLRSYE